MVLVMTPPLPKKPGSLGDTSVSDSIQLERVQVLPTPTPEERKRNIELATKLNIKPKYAPGTFTYLSPEYRKERATSALDNYYAALDKIIEMRPDSTEAGLAAGVKADLQEAFEKKLKVLDSIQKRTEKEEKGKDIRREVLLGGLHRSKFVGKEIRKAEVDEAFRTSLDRYAATGDNVTEDDIQAVNEAKGNLSTLLDTELDKMGAQEKDVDYSAVDAVVAQAHEKERRSAEPAQPQEGQGAALGNALAGAIEHAKAEGGEFVVRKAPEEPEKLSEGEQGNSTEEENPYSDENIRKVMDTIKIYPGTGQLIAVMGTSEGGEDVVEQYEIAEYDKDKKVMILKKFPGGTKTIEMRPGQAKEFLARQYIHSELKKAAREREERERKEKIRAERKSVEIVTKGQKKEKQEVKTSKLESFRARAFGVTLEGKDHGLNMDSFFVDSDHGAIGVLDGVGSRADGASQYAAPKVKTFLSGLPNSLSEQEIREKTETFITELQKEVTALPDSPATTATFAKAFINEKGEWKLCVVNIGDSRTYVIRDGSIVFETFDQMGDRSSPEKPARVLEYFIEKISKDKNVDKEYARKIILKAAKDIQEIPYITTSLRESQIAAILENIGVDYDSEWEMGDRGWYGFKYIATIYGNSNQTLDQALGGNIASPAIDIIDIQPNDIVLSFSDGLNGNFTDAEILEIIKGVPCDTMPEALMNAVRSKWERERKQYERYKEDDTTIAVLEIGKGVQNTSAPTSPPHDQEQKEEQEAQKMKEGEPAQKREGWLEKGDAIRLLDAASGKIDTWTIDKIEERKSKPKLVTVSNGTEMREVDMNVLRKLVWETKKYEEEQGRERQEVGENKRFKEGDVVQLFGEFGTLESWTISKIEKEGKITMATISDGKREQKIGMSDLHRHIRTAQKYEDTKARQEQGDVTPERRNLPPLVPGHLFILARGNQIDEVRIQNIENGIVRFYSIKDRARGNETLSIQEFRNLITTEQTVSIPPIKNFFAQFNAKLKFSPDGLEGWKRKWVDTGDIDKYRRANGTIEIPDDQVRIAKQALELCIQTLRNKHNLGEALRMKIVDIAGSSARILTGVQDKTANDIEFDVKDNILGRKVTELERELRENVMRPTPLGQVRIGQTIKLRGQNPIKLNSAEDVKNYQDYLAFRDQQAAGEKAFEKMQSDNETYRIYQDAYYANPDEFLSIYADKRDAGNGDFIYTRNKKLLEHPYRAMIEHIITSAGHTLDDATRSEQKRDAWDEREARLRKEADGSIGTHRLMYAPSLDPHSPQASYDEHGNVIVSPGAPRPGEPRTESKKLDYPTTYDWTKRDEVDAQKPKVNINETSDMQSMTPPERMQMAEPREEHEEEAPEVDIEQQAPEQNEQTPHQDMVAVNAVMEERASRLPRNWKAWATVIALAAGAAGLATYLSKEKEVGKPDAITPPPSAAAKEGQPILWPKYVHAIKIMKNEVRQRLYDTYFASDIKKLDAAALLRKFAPTHFTGSSDPTRMKLALNWRGEDIVNDNSGNLFGHLSPTERGELSDLWLVLKDTAMATSGQPLQAKTFEEAVKEVKQKVSKKESE